MVPADQESIRIWGIHGIDDRSGQFFLFREVLGGGSGGRWYADGSDVVHIVPNSRNLPVEFSETRYPVIIESLGLKVDSGGAGERRGGLGYHKRIRVLQEASLLSNADRSLISPYGLNGGKAGGNYGVGVERPGGFERLPGLSDDIHLNPGDVIEIITTGGGGWGDPLDRDAELVRMDVVRGVVTHDSAYHDYGVVLEKAWETTVDAAGTKARRAELRVGDEKRMFDRGTYYRELRASGKVPQLQGWPNDPDVMT
jgi:N-methylhydantoinase B